MKTVAIIPVRGGSKSIPLKNIKLINGRPLVYWTIDVAVNCKWIDEVYISTDNEEIRNIVLNYNQDNYEKLNIIDRSVETASDTASTESVMIEFAKNVSSDTVVLLQATSPLTKTQHLDEAFQKYFDEKLDSLLTVVNQKRFIWTKDGQPINYSPTSRPRRQDFEGYLVENGAFYITKTDLLLESQSRLSGNIGVYEMPEETYFELDEPSDWLIVEKLLQVSKKKTSKSNKIKLFATDCDGVLTDAGMYYTDAGDVMKKFNTKDGMGFSLLKEQGIITVILTGENSKIVAKRAEKLQIDEVYLGCKDKLTAMEELLKKYHLKMDEVAYIGDDLNDLALLKQVGYSFSVADAIERVKKEVHYVTERRGGQGAVREAIEHLLNREKE